MSDDNLRSLVAARAAAAAIDVQPGALDLCADYLRVLARWNRRINLTALPVDPPTEAAVDRLIVEPLQAARHIGVGDRRAIDIGSGGGSPALPMKIAAPHLAMSLVESRSRKAAFLREAVRLLGLPDIAVINARLDASIGQTTEIQNGSFQLASIRAVRFDASFQELVHSLLAADGRIFWFCGTADGSTFDASLFALEHSEPLISPQSELRILVKRSA